MRLNKSICKACWSEWITEQDGEIDGWLENRFNEDWNEFGIVCCPLSDAVTINEMPKFCKYSLEQVVMNETQ